MDCQLFAWLNILSTLKLLFDDSLLLSVFLTNVIKWHYEDDMKDEGDQNYEEDDVNEAIILKRSIQFWR